MNTWYIVSQNERWFSQDFWASEHISNKKQKNKRKSIVFNAIYNKDKTFTRTRRDYSSKRARRAMQKYEKKKKEKKRGAQIEGKMNTRRSSRVGKMIIEVGRRMHIHRDEKSSAAIQSHQGWTPAATERKITSTANFSKKRWSLVNIDLFSFSRANSRATNASLFAFFRSRKQGWRLQDHLQDVPLFRRAMRLFLFWCA